MKTLLLSLCMLHIACCISHAQLYNDAITTNDGGLMSDYSAQWYNNAAGSYTGKTAAVFEHFGPSANTFVNNGSYSYGTGGMSDKFLGPNGAAGTQEIGGSSTPLFYDLVFNNGSSSTIAITNSNGVQIGNSFTFSNGITTTVRSNAATGSLRLDASATYSGTMGAARHVNGYISKTGTASFTFPVGDGTQYRPLAYTTPPSASTDQLAIAYIDGDPGTALDPTGGAHSRSSFSSAGTTGTTKITSVSSTGFWDWVPVAGTSAISFTVSIPNMSSVYSVASSMRIVGWNTVNSQWENLSGSTGASSTAAGTVMSGSVSNMSNYSAIGIGSVSQIPLPITYLMFTAKAEGCKVLLSWATASKCESFDVERSSNGISWDGIQHLSAMSNTAEYGSTDEHPLSGKNYYRIQLHVASGSFTYTNVALANNECGALPGITVSPNPFGERLNIGGMAPGTRIKISSADGRLVYSGMADDKTSIQTGSWPAGMYTVRVTRGAKEVSTVQVVKK